MLIDHDGTTDGTFCLALRVWRDPFKPCGLWVRIDTFLRCQVNTGVSHVIEDVEIIQIQWWSIDHRPVDFWHRVHNLLPNIGGSVGVLAVQPDERGWNDISCLYTRRYCQAN